MCLIARGSWWACPDYLHCSFDPCWGDGADLEIRPLSHTGPVRPSCIKYGTTSFQHKCTWKVWRRVGIDIAVTYSKTRLCMWQVPVVCHTLCLWVYKQFNLCSISTKSPPMRKCAEQFMLSARRRGRADYPQSVPPRITPFALCINQRNCQCQTCMWVFRSSFALFVQSQGLQQFGPFPLCINGTNAKWGSSFQMSTQT